MRAQLPIVCDSTPPGPRRTRSRTGVPDDLFIARAAFRDFAARGIELQRHLAQLLLVHEYAPPR